MICVAAALVGCSKKAISKDELRAVTTEVVNAAQNVTGHHAEIKIRPTAAPGQAGIPAGPGFDDVYISLGDPKQAPALKASLEDIAKRHALTFATSSSGGVTRYDFSFHGARTHSIHVVTPAWAEDRAECAVETVASSDQGWAAASDHHRRYRKRPGGRGFGARAEFPGDGFRAASPDTLRRNRGGSSSPRRSGDAAHADAVRR